MPAVAVSALTDLLPWTGWAASVEMALLTDEEDFSRLFPRVRRLERSYAFRTFRYARKEFDRVSPDATGEENTRKAMKFAFYTAGYWWIILSVIPGLPGAILLSFHSNVVVDVLAGALLVPTVVAFRLGINRYQQAQAIYPQRVRSTWAGILTPRLPDDE